MKYIKNSRIFYFRLEFIISREKIINLDRIENGNTSSNNQSYFL